MVLGGYLPGWYAATNDLLQLWGIPERRAFGEGLWPCGRRQKGVGGGVLYWYEQMKESRYGATETELPETA